MFLDSNKPNECCGCMACVDACPQSCIGVKQDGEGFLYPYITDLTKCIHCEKCSRVCPMAHGRIGLGQETQKCYYGWIRDENDRMLSTSGGASAAIMRLCALQGYNYFFGAFYNDAIEVVHIGVDNVSETDAFRNSKYVQSNTRGIYKEIKGLLGSGKRVVFSGTPCQVAGLINSVSGKERENLLTVSLVCHGVSSPAVLKKYLHEEEAIHESKVTSIRFRDVRKNELGKQSYNYTTIKFENGTESSSNNNLYTLMFGLGYINRPSCFQCPYTTVNRNCDLTIGDFWGLSDLLPDTKYEVYKGISLLIAHSEKGKSLVSDLSANMYIEETPIGFATNPKQPQLTKPLKEPKLRHWVISRSCTHSFIPLARRIAQLNRVNQAVRRLNKFKKHC